MFAKLLAPFKLFVAIFILIPSLIVLSCSGAEEECHVNKICTNYSDGAQ